MDGLPLYRIAALLARFGGDLSRSTLAASVVRIGEAIQSIINLLQDHLLESDIVHGDETVVQVLKEPGRPAQRKSYLWAQMNGSGPPVILFGYGPTHVTFARPPAITLFAALPYIRELEARNRQLFERVQYLEEQFRLAHLKRFAPSSEKRPVRRRSRADASHYRSICRASASNTTCQRIQPDADVPGVRRRAMDVPARGTDRTATASGWRRYLGLAAVALRTAARLGRVTYLAALLRSQLFSMHVPFRI